MLTHIVPAPDDRYIQGNSGKNNRQGKQSYSVKHKFQCNFVRHAPHMNYNGTEPRTMQQEAGKHGHLIHFISSFKSK